MKTFYQILGNTVIANITNMTVWFALIFFVYLETRSVMATSIVSGLYLVAVAVSGIWFGSLVDHYRKKTVMMASGFVSLFIYLLAFGIFLGSPAETWKDAGSPILWVFVPLILAGVVAGNIRGIALPTLVTLLISEEERDKANGMVGTAMGIAFLIVSAISGFLVGQFGMSSVFIFAILLMIITLVHLFFLAVPEREILHTEHKPEGGAKMDLRGTIAIITAVPGLFALIFFTTFNNFLGGVFMGLMDAYGLSLVDVEVWGKTHCAPCSPPISPSG
jgi:DHA3 family multidrug efflux protein-like MFS transporter